MTKSVSEVARLFGVIDNMEGANFGADVYPGYPGAVFANGSLQQMSWGFPLKRTSEKTGKPLKPKPINNARTDKLGTFFWRYSFEERRCLIPLSAWAEAEGPRGAMTRTWLSLPETDIFAVAGIWQDTPEWGRCYSMVMTDAAGDVAKIHSRMPVLISVDDYAQWTKGTLDDARSLCRPWEGPLEITRTDTPWNATH